MQGTALVYPKLFRTEFKEPPKEFLSIGFQRVTPKHSSHSPARTWTADHSSTAITVQHALGQQIIGSEPAGAHSSKLLLQCLDLGLGLLLLSLKLLVLLSSFDRFFIFGCNAGICSLAHLLTAGLKQHKVDRSATAPASFQCVAEVCYIKNRDSPSHLLVAADV